MSRTKILLLSLLAVLVVSLTASAAASAALEGPWWLKREQAKQVKINQAKKMQVKSSNLLNKRATFKIITKTKTIECQIVTGKGWIWDAEHLGLGEGVLLFSGCTLQESGCAVKRVATLDQAKIRTALIWKYQGEKKELEEQGQQKIYELFAPGHHIEHYEIVFLRAPFMSIKAPPEGTCPELASQLYAEGSTALWEIQPGLDEELVWGTAAQVEPQNLDQGLVTLNWQLPNVQNFHAGGGVADTVLQLTGNTGGEIAEIEGKIYLTEESGLTEFGAWDKA